ncbi:GNAT family N-acetyltransferase [Candidatus Roizmanbacteria bacterium]|nr:GNAT family N-acetyltransferase [Candidatus Roizmanbacteria bacterium]
MELGKIVYKGKTKKGLKIIIRYPVKGDVEMLLKYINTLSKECTFITFQGEQLTLEEEKKYSDNFIEKIEKDLAVKLLVFTTNKLIAVSDIAPSDKIESHIGTFGITVANEYRNQGIGKLLTELVLDEAKKNLKQLRIVKLGVFVNNPIAKIMYEKFGFIQYGNLPEGVKHKSKYVNHLYMYKKIR